MKMPSRGRWKPRRWPPTRRALWAHRLALGAVGPLIRPRSAPHPGRSRVTVLLMDAYDMTGVVRALLNIAGHLAARHDVEIVSVVRRRDEPPFPLPPGVRVTTLDDQRRGTRHGWRRWMRAAVRRFSSRLVHPADIATP